MRFLHDVPIRRKLTIITMLATVLALVFACVAFTIYDQVVLRRDLVRGLSGTAEMIGFNSASALSFDDPASAGETLKSLAAYRNLTGACIYRRDGGIFATYHRAGLEPRSFPIRPARDGATFGDDAVELWRRITLDGEVIGTVHLRSDFSELRERMMLSGLIFVVVILGAGLVAFAIVSRLQRVISGPISRLAAVAEQVATENNYSVRVAKHGNDEVGALIDGFNGMLAQIQSRDAALQRAQSELEERVELRTRELSAEIIERRRSEEERNRVFTLSLDFLCIARFDGFLRQVNPALGKALGMTMEQLETMPYIDVVHPDDRKSTMYKLARLLKGSAVQHFENRCRCADGTYLTIMWTGIPFPEEKCFYAYGRDVTELKRAQERSAREQARLKFIFESVPVGISLCNTKLDGTRKRLINDAHLRICDIDRTEADLPDTFQRISHPDDYAQQILANRQLVAREIKGYTMEKRYLRPSGEVVWVSFSIQRHDYPDGSYEELSTVVDITALKQAQEHGAREEARLKFIFDSVPVGICLDHLAANGERNRVLNDAHLRICGLSREEAIVGAFQNITHPDDQAQQNVLRRQLELGFIGRFSLEKRYLKPNDEVVWVAYSVQRQRFADGSYQDLSTVVDITEVKRAQVEIMRERARFKFIFDSVPVGISLVLPDREDSFVVNPAHARITGIPDDRLLWPEIFERATHPDDFVRQRALVQRYKSGEIDHFELEKRYIHPDGRVVWAALTRRMFIDPATGQKQSITTVIDITELKAAQEEVAGERARFKFIFESVPVGISLVMPGQDGTHLVNPAHASITGISIEDSSRPGVFASVSHPDDLRVQHEFVKRYAAGEIDHFTVEKRYLHAAGKIVWAALTSRFFTDPATARQQSITTLVDITERKEAEAKLAETHKQLLDTSRQAGMAEVATGVLHNVGNVLNSVNVSTTLLTDLVRQSKITNVTKLGNLLTEQKDNLGGFFSTDPRGQKVPGFVQSLSTHLAREQSDLLGELDSLRKNVEHIKEIVAMQQNYAKVSGVSETLLVTELIEDAVRMSTSAVHGPGVKLVRDFQSHPRVTVDKHKVLQILVNLLRNAKFACEDSPRADKETVVRVTVENGRVRIAVVDNGVGIPAENLTRIFSHGFTTRKHGHGFGLHSGALAAKEVGGSLLATSAGPGCGATFVLELPEFLEAAA